MASIALFILLTAGIVLFIQKNNDHKECSDVVEQKVDANGDTVISRRHVCKELFSF